MRHNPSRSRPRLHLHELALLTGLWSTGCGLGLLSGAWQYLIVWVALTSFALATAAMASRGRRQSSVGAVVQFCFPEAPSRYFWAAMATIGVSAVGGAGMGYLIVFAFL